MSSLDNYLQCWSMVLSSQKILNVNEHHFFCENQDIQRAIFGYVLSKKSFTAKL